MYSRRRIFLFFTITTVLLIFYFSAVGIKNLPNLTSSLNSSYSQWPRLVVKSSYDQSWFRRRCLKEKSLLFSVSNLEDITQQWSQSEDFHCKDLHRKFSSVFRIEKRRAPILFPKPFEMKMRSWLGNDEDLFQQSRQQEIIHIYNYYTREETIFNPLREKRPVVRPKESEEDYVERLVSESEISCDFCSYRNFTAEHVIHRLESKHAFTASNAFKMDNWHALFVLKKHHPLKWTLEEFMDMMLLSVKWFRAASVFDNKSQYPLIVWDLFPKAGVSQIHPHMHGFLDPTSYHGVIEMWRSAAESYFRNTGTNYFQDLVHFYSLLGLTAHYGNAVVFASLIPRKDNEVVVISQEADEHFFELIYFVLRAFVDDRKLFSFSLGIGLPALKNSKGRIPAYARIITRGTVSDMRTDISSLELFAATNVNIDPWKVIVYVRNSIKKRS